MFCVRDNKTMESTRNGVVAVYIDASCICRIYTCFIKDKILHVYTRKYVFHVYLYIYKQYPALSQVG